MSRVRESQEKGQTSADLDVAAERVVTHMRALGPHAKVMLLVGHEAQVFDEEEGPIDGKLGILQLYGGEFSAVRRHDQMTHEKGGIIKCVPIHYIHKLRGMIFSMVWAENVPTEGDIALNAREEARRMLRIDPCEWIESTDGATIAQINGE